VFALLVGCGLALLGAQLTTQWLAHRLGYQPALGAPLARTIVGPLYTPWSALAWTEQLGTTPAALELAGGADAALNLTVVAAALGAVAALIRRRRSYTNRASELHGSARWATRDDIEQTGLLDTRGVIVGRWHDTSANRVRWLRTDGPEHMLLFAPTGSGKGVGPVLSTLLTWAESLVVLDPKGENFQLTSGWRASFSRVYRLDFTDDPSVASAFNPLAEIRIRTPRETADVQRIALQLLSPKGESESEAARYFINAGADLLTGALLHVLYRESAKGRTATLADVAQELSDPTRSHSQVLEQWLSHPHDPTFEQGWLDATGARTATHPLVAMSARAQRNRDPKDRSPILSTVVAALSLFRDPLLVAHTSRSDFRITDLVAGERPVTLYLVLRLADQDRLRPLVRLLLDLWIARLTEDTVHADAPVRRRLLVLLDEFPILGKLPIIETALAAARGWGLKFFLVAQDYEQLVGAYGKYETLLSNCGIRAAYTPNKPETAKLLSALVGTTTVRKETQTRSTTFGALFSRRDSLAEQEVKRELLTPDECMRLPAPRKTSGDRPRILEAGDMLVFASGFPAIYAKQPLYFQDPILLERSQRVPSTPRPADIIFLPPRLPEPPQPAPPAAPPLATEGPALTAADVDDAILALAGIRDGAAESEEAEDDTAEEATEEDDEDDDALDEASADTDFAGVEGEDAS
jgi:type IV secretion system protein VirD4